MATEEKTEHLSDDLSTDMLLEWYSRMELMRRFENHAERHYQEGRGSA